MHPQPMNRGIEIASDVADGPQSVIRDQVRNGVAVRMAVLAEVILKPRIDLGLEVGARVGVQQRLIQGHAVLLHQGMQGDIEALHAALAAGDDGLLDAPPRRLS